MSSSNNGGKRPGSWDGPPAQAPPNRTRRGPELEPGELEPGEIEPAGYSGGGSRGATGCAHAHAHAHEVSSHRLSSWSHRAPRCR